MSPLAISLRFLQTQPDARLVELARAGHERAFEALVRRYRGPLLAYCRRVAPRGTAPEDILQQGLLQAWKSISAGSEVREARAWLYRIVHNVAISALRAGGELPDNVVPGPGAPGVDQLVEQRMAAREALAGLAALPDLQRQVMVSTALDGASHEEIAAALGLSSGSVRGLIYRARSTLRAAAAAVIPAPVIDWALGDAGGTAGTLAGGGAAGVGALMVKGGAILAVGAVGAIAGTAAIIAGHHGRRGAPAIVFRTENQADHQRAADGAQGVDDGLRTSGRTSGDAAAAREDRSGRGPDGGDRSGRRHDGSGDGSRSGSDGSGDGSGGGGSSSGSDGGSGSGSDGGGSSSGTDGGGGGTTTSVSGSDGGGDNGATTATSGSDGGGSGTTTTSSGSDGGGGTTTTTSSGSDGGGSGSGSSDGGSSDGGTSTTTTTTSGGN